MDWSGYNEELVRRGEAVFDLDFLENHRDKLRRMNVNRVKSGLEPIDPKYPVKEKRGHH